MDVERITDIMVFACNTLVFTLGNVTWSAYDCTIDVKIASERIRDVKKFEESIGYNITCYPSNKDSYDILLLPVAKNGKPCIIVVLPDQRMNYFFFHKDMRKMHSELSQLYRYIGSYVTEHEQQKLRSLKQRKRRL